MKLTSQQSDERFYALPDVLRNLSHDNPIVYDLIEQYVRGRIVTREELLLQCILHLNTRWDKLIKDYIDYKALVVQPLILPREA